MIKKLLPLLIMMSIVGGACKKTDSTGDPATGGGSPTDQPTAANEASSTIIVDCAAVEGKMIEMEKYNGSSTTSPLPGAAARNFLQGLHTKLTRVWIQLVFVYNNGNTNYNYQYSSGVPVEDALNFYSTTSDSLLVCLSGHRTSGNFNMPTTGTAYKDFVRETLLYYKRKYPKIKYIQCSNEPDNAGETMATYYPVYQYYYRGLNEANEILRLEYLSRGQTYDKMLLSNAGFTSNITGMLAYASTFFASYAADTDPSKKFDFFSFHSYGEANRPIELLAARTKIDSTIMSYGLPRIPVFLSEFGMVGGSSLPSGFNMAQAVTMQPAAQLTKAFYLYEGGVDKALNWLIHHESIEYKSQLLDLQNGITSPYGNALLLSQKMSELKNRLKVSSKGISDVGLGTHALASKGDVKDVAALVWNYNWTNSYSDKIIYVMLKNIPAAQFAGKKVRMNTYVVDSRYNNYFINPSQTSLTVTTSQLVDYKSFYMLPVMLERNAVVLITLSPE